MSNLLAIGPPESSAVISPCGTYRYELNRVWDWDSELPVVGWIMLNPSKADAFRNDSTIQRCRGFTKQWGYPGMVVWNLHALRTTNPHELRRHPDPIGPENAAYLAGAIHCAFTVCAWGSHPLAVEPGRKLIAELTATGVDVRCLGLTKTGHPRHPLYVSNSTTLQVVTP